MLQFTIWLFKRSVLIRLSSHVPVTPEDLRKIGLLVKQFTEGLRQSQERTLQLAAGFFLANRAKALNLDSTIVTVSGAVS